MIGFDEACPTLTAEFQYPEDSIDAPSEMDVALEIQRRIWAWVYQPPCEDLNGLTCRCLIACWVFVPQLREYSQSEFAGRCGKKKQSLNRWIKDFKRTFPDVTKHLQHIKHE